jgi:3-hydroxyisobutyrate dehydrogenase-like beta-hydroxyacid dehydrogenase
MKISFLGTGLMGIPMAQQLMQAGADLVVYNPQPVGTAAALKLAFNQMIAALTTGFAQSLAYLQQQGVDLD